jgi:hypothetical protein
VLGSNGRDEAGVKMDEITEDEKTFGHDAWVYCSQHLRPHRTGWCTVHADQKTALDAATTEDAYAECRRLGLIIYGDK